MFNPIYSILNTLRTTGFIATEAVRKRNEEAENKTAEQRREESRKIEEFKTNEKNDVPRMIRLLDALMNPNCSFSHIPGKEFSWPTHRFTTQETKNKIIEHYQNLGYNIKIENNMFIINWE